MRHRLQKDPDDFTAHFQLGALRQARLDPVEGLAMLRAAVRIQPDHAEARNLLGSALVAMGRNTEALEQFRAAVKARPDYGNARYNLARSLARAGKPEEAVENFEIVEKQFPSDASVRHELADLYLRQNNFAAAVEQFDQALAIDPADVSARKSRGAALSQMPTKAKTEQAGEIRWVEPHKPLPAFTLRALDGKTWKLADLNGKVVVIDLWATWCVPCRAELPEFQKLYEQWKDRPDVAVISFNVDDDPAVIAPYVAENHYTFPVLRANALVDGYLSVAFIPQTWFLDAQGQLRWIHEGYGSDAAWLDTMTAKLAEVLEER
jgi:tetratricopeptide (TPR) repeat protein